MADALLTLFHHVLLNSLDRAPTLSSFPWRRPAALWWLKRVSSSSPTHCLVQYYLVPMYLWLTEFGYLIFNSCLQFVRATMARWFSFSPKESPWNSGLNFLPFSPDLSSVLSLTNFCPCFSDSTCVISNWKATHNVFVFLPDQRNSLVLSIAYICPFL